MKGIYLRGVFGVQARGIQGFLGTAIVRGLLLLQAARAFWTKKNSVEERRPQKDFKSDEQKLSRTALPGMDVSNLRHVVGSACFQVGSTTCEVSKIQQ